MASAEHFREAPVQNASVEDTAKAPLPLGSFLPYRFSVVAECLSRRFAEHYERRFNISIPEWRVMAVLGEHAPQSTQEVISRTEMDRVRVSRAAIRLEDKGLIARKTHPQDQRAHLMGLTRKGLATYRQIVPLARILQRELEAALSTDEMQALDRILTKLHARLTELAPGEGR